MPKLPSWIRSERFTETKFQPYVTAIGRLVLTWNGLHEDLATLFCRLIGDGEEISRTLAIWHAPTFDRPKRAMFLDALNAQKHLKAHDQKEADQKKLDDLIWLVKETTKLEDQRNDAVHSPLILLGYGPLATYAGKAGAVIPDVLNKHPRALALTKREALEYFRWITRRLAVLRRFARAADDAWDGAKPWPDRPPLPGPPEKKQNPWEAIPGKQIMTSTPASIIAGVISTFSPPSSPMVHLAVQKGAQIR